MPKVSDYFTQANNEYLVMDYVEGENLQSVLDRYLRQYRQPLPEASVLPWIDQVLDALEYLHGQQPYAIIHRDIKPSNIILTAQGKVKLVDFGLVKLLDPLRPGTATVVKGFGTPEYAALEQHAQGAYGHTDARTDIYALGATLYHLLTGAAPPDAVRLAVNPASLTPPRQANPALSAAGEAAILRAMAVRPDQRFQTAREMRLALPGASSGSQPPPSSAKGRLPGWVVGAAAGAALVTMMFLVAQALFPRIRAAAPAAAPVLSATSTAMPTLPTEAPPEPPTITPVSTVPTEPSTTIPTVDLGTSNVFVEYILDASDSMTERLSDGSSKIEVAKRVLTDHMRSFRPETNIGLRVYGHRLPYQQTAESCQDIEVIAPVDKGQMGRIVGFLQDFKPQGMTPLAASLQQAKEDFVFEATHINSIVMLSDGIETCGGDPCKLVEDLKAQGINFTIHVIGLDVDNPTRKQLSCIAQAGGGTYHDAMTQQELGTALGAVEADVTKDEVVVPPGMDTSMPADTGHRRRR